MTSALPTDSQVRQCAEYAASLRRLPSVEAIDWANWEPTVEAVLCYISNAKTAEILLIKRLSSYAHGLISGPGGKLHKGETPPQCAVRECREEVGLRPQNLRLGADLYFHFTAGPRMRVYAYVTSQWSGQLQASAEAIPFWCQRDRLPFAAMWQDDALWLPYVLDGGKVNGYFVFAQGNQMLSHKLIWENPTLAATGDAQTPNQPIAPCSIAPAAN